QRGYHSISPLPPPPPPPKTPLRLFLHLLHYSPAPSAPPLCSSLLFFPSSHVLSSPLLSSHVIMSSSLALLRSCHPSSSPPLSSPPLPSPLLSSLLLSSPQRADWSQHVCYSVSLF